MIPNKRHHAAWLTLIALAGAWSLHQASWRPVAWTAGAYLAVQALAFGRDQWTTWYLDSPEAPRPDQHAPRSQRLAWTLLHSIDPLMPPVPEQIDRPLYERRPVALPTRSIDPTDPTRSIGPRDATRSIDSADPTRSCPPCDLPRIRNPGSHHHDRPVNPAGTIDVCGRCGRRWKVRQHLTGLTWHKPLRW